MELLFTTVAVIGGMTFSLAVAILVEELIFGKVLCVFFAPRSTPTQTRDSALGPGYGAPWNLCGQARVNVDRTV